MINQINSWLFQGDYESVADGEYALYGIQAIVCVTEDDPPKRIFGTSHMRYLWMPFDDWGTTLTEGKLMSIIDFAAKAKMDGEKLLVHCFAGGNRSSAICGLILCLVNCEFTLQACRLVLEKN